MNSMGSCRGFRVKNSLDLLGSPSPNTLQLHSIYLFSSSISPSSLSSLPPSSDPLTGESPLHVAVTLNNETVISQLLELGASLAVQDLKGKTPVMTACEYGHLQALEYLAERGINATGKD